MTYEERQQYRRSRDKIDALRAALSEGDGDRLLTRREGLELLALVEDAVERTSPERWDQALVLVADEAARRADAMGGHHR